MITVAVIHGNAHRAKEYNEFMSEMYRYIYSKTLADIRVDIESVKIALQISNFDALHERLDFYTTVYNHALTCNYKDAYNEYYIKRSENK